MSWEEIIHLSNASDENGEYLELYISSGEPYRNPFKFINGLICSISLGQMLGFHRSFLQCADDLVS